MNNIIKTVIGAVALAALAGCVEDTGSTSVSTAAPLPSDLNDFVGARAGQAEGGLRTLGYEPIRSEGLTTYWFNRSTGVCAAITTSDGRYANINTVPAEDC